MNVILNIKGNKQIISTFKSYTNNTKYFQKLNHPDDLAIMLKLDSITKQPFYGCS
jgi:hypothetical protein